jgi:hypothetical protein
MNVNIHVPYVERLQKGCQIEFLLSRVKPRKIRSNIDKSVFGNRSLSGHFLFRIGQNGNRSKGMILLRVLMREKKDEGGRLCWDLLILFQELPERGNLVDFIV